MSTPQHDLFGVWFGRVEHAIVNALIEAYPNRVDRITLTDTIYADDPEGGPDNALTGLRVMIANIRAKLKGTGWTIPKMTGGSGEKYGGYRLTRE